MTANDNRRHLLGEVPPAETRWGAGSSTSMVPRRTDSRQSVVLGTLEVVAGRSGDDRGLLTVSCPWCGSLHLHFAAADFRTGSRRALCGAGRYVVVVPRRGGGGDV